MRKITLFLVASVFVLGLFSFNWMSSQQAYEMDINMDGLEMSEDVQAIVDNNCYGCHHTESKNEKGKKKLNFDSFGGDYNNFKSASKLKKISEVVSEGEMPPKKFLEHYPEKALTDDQKNLLSDWAIAESAKYLDKK